MVNEMDNLLNAVRAVAAEVFDEYALRGGVIRNGSQALSVDEASSLGGALTPIIWMCREFIAEYDIEFPQPMYQADPEALSGVSITGMDVSRSSSPMVFMLADFLRHEIVPQGIMDFDVSVLVANFKDWAVENVPGFEAQQAQAPSGHDREPE